MQALSGRIVGLNITFSSGGPGLNGNGMDFTVHATANGASVRSRPLSAQNNSASANLGLTDLKGLTMNEKKDFPEGAYYLTINPKKYPNGIIRGQLAATKQ